MLFVVNVLCIIKEKHNPRKFDTKSNEVLFTGYSSLSKVFYMYNKKTLKIKESIHIVFDESMIFREIMMMINKEVDSLLH